jgi:transcription initiation factor TFIIH subunit 3
MEEEGSSLLLLLLDASTPFWREREAEQRRAAAAASSASAPAGRKGSSPPPITFQETLEALLLFVQSYLLMHRRNEIAFVICSRSGARMLYPTPELEKTGRMLSNGAVSTKDFQELVRSGVRAVVEQDASSDEAGSPGSLVRGLSQGLCFVNRRAKEIPGLQLRTLVLQAESDASQNYNATMNCIFSAQKMGMIVDCCCVGNEPSLFMQQAANITEGIFFHSRETGLLQHLLTTFLPSKHCRKFLRSERPEVVDFRAACFCHQNIIDVAYVCSVCLSVFCEFSPVCSTCGTKAPRSMSKGRRK